MSFKIHQFSSHCRNFRPHGVQSEGQHDADCSQARACGLSMSFKVRNRGGDREGNSSAAQAARPTAPSTRLAMALDILCTSSRHTKHKPRGKCAMSFKVRKHQAPRQSFILVHFGTCSGPFYPRQIPTGCLGTLLKRWKKSGIARIGNLRSTAQ